MPLAAAEDASGPVSLILACLVGAAAIFLGYRQFRDRGTRPIGQASRDRNYFAIQDLRRFLGTAILLILAAAIGVGGRMPARLNGRANLTFIQLWAGVAFLIAALLILALMDFFSTRLYVRRLRDRLAREGLDLVEAELRIRMAARRAKENRAGDGTNGSHYPESKS